MGNLSLLRTLPGALNLNTGRGTLLKALDLVKKGPEELMVQMAA